MGQAETYHRLRLFARLRLLKENSKRQREFNKDAKKIRWTIPEIAASVSGYVSFSVNKMNLLIFLLTIFGICYAEVPLYWVLYGEGIYDMNFSAERFKFADGCGGVKNIDVLHSINPELKILKYEDIMAMHIHYSDWDEVNLHEDWFLHSACPASLSFLKENGRYTLFWREDRRSAQYYNIYCDNRLIGSTTDTQFLTDNSGCFEVRSVIEKRERLYSWPATPTFTSLYLYDSNFSVEGNLYSFWVKSEGEPEKVYLYCDINYDKDFSDEGEQYNMVKDGDRWSVQFTCTPTYGDWECEYKGGVPFYFVAEKGQDSFKLPSNMYTTNINNRLKQGYYGWYVIDVRNTGWQEHYANRCYGNITDFGYDGVYADDVNWWYGTSSFISEGVPGGGFTQDSWREGLSQTLAKTKDKIRENLLIFNGLTGDVPLGFLENADGGSLEGYCCAWWYRDRFFPEDRWKKQLTVQIETEKRGKLFWALSCGGGDDDIQARLYCLASYFIGKGENSYFYYANPYRPLRYFPEWDVDLGSPTESHDSIEDYKNSFGIYERDYLKGKVLVNPTEATITQTFERTYHLLKVEGESSFSGGRLWTEPTEELSLPPHSGAILLKRSVRSPEILSVKFTPEIPEPGDLVSVEIETEPEDCRVWLDLSEVEGGYIEGRKIEFQIPYGFSSGTRTVKVRAESSGYNRFCTTTFTIGGDNLIKNASFEFIEEERVEEWIHWQNYGIYRIEEGHFGSSAVCFVSSDFSTKRGLNQKIELKQKEAEPIKISGWSKAEGVFGTRTWHYSVWCDLRYTDGEYDWGYILPFDHGTHTWQLREMVIFPEKPIEYARIWCLFRYHKGKVWFDDIYLGYSTETDESPPDPISDLKIEEIGSDYVVLSWTKPADLYRHHLGISTEPIENRDLAIWREIPHNMNTYRLTLLTNTPYYFGIKAEDPAGNISSLSNIVCGTTALYPAYCLKSSYKNYPYYHKGQLHCHTTNSDGELSPEELMQAYREEGFSFVAITDHNFVTPDPGVEGILHIKGDEISVWNENWSHCLGIGIETHASFSKIRDVIDHILSEGGIAIAAHPHRDFSSWTNTHLATEGLIGIEIPSEEEYVHKKWDLPLACGVRLYGFLTDDAHSASVGHRYIMVNSESPLCTEENVLEQIKAGNFYSTRNLEILERAEAKDKTATIYLKEPATIRWLNFSGIMLEEYGTVSSYTYSGEYRGGYVRCEIEKDGWRRIYLQPFWILPLPKIVLKKSFVLLGDRITYKIRYENCGSAEAENVVIIDVIPENCKLSAVSSQPDYWVDGKWQSEFSDKAEKIRWIIPEVAPAESGSVSFICEVE